MPDYNPNVIANPQVAEYGKFTQLNGSRFPAVSVTRVQYPDKSQAFPGNTNALPVTTIDIYPKFGVLSYITNTDDFAVSLSAGQINLDTSLIEFHISNIDAETTIMANALTATEWNTFDAASGINELNFNFLNAVSALSTTIVNPVIIGNRGNGNTATVYAPTSSLNVNVTNTINSITTPEPTQLDAFGRLRVSTPLTLFDSSHRYRDNNLWSSLTAVGGTYAFNANQGLIDLTVSSLSGSSVIRETTKVFSYQPGKSLLVMNTFVMASSATDLRQRVGYFGSQNGIYFQLDDGNIGLVKRSLVSGSVVDTIVLRSSWNGDKLDGTGASGLTLDITKAQIFWMDIEWLGVGSVRTGFIINGQYIVCHSFHHANIIDSTYITTASLPLRYEITNKAATGVSKTLKQICSSVVSEGGYELRGLQQAVGTAITAPRSLGTPAGTYRPVVSIRLKTSPNRLDAIVILTALSVMGVDTGIYSWRVIASGTTVDGTWQDAGVDSAVEYKLDGTSITGGRILAQGYLTSNAQGATTVDILKEALFKFQLERNGLTGVPYELTLAVAASTQNEVVHASMDWEEISR
jgi:hypothetical protein